MSVEVAKLPFSELSLVQEPQGNYYHSKGNYALETDNGQLVPANRSYVINSVGNRNNGVDKDSYRKQELIHELVGEEDILAGREVLINMFGKQLLFLKSQDCIWYDSIDTSSPKLSAQALNLVHKIQDGLSRIGFGDNYQLGVFGSHRVSLGGVDSDIDLLSWVDFGLRKSFTADIEQVLNGLGFVSIRYSGKNEEYAIRYARRFNMSYLAGWYLASKRMRFVSPGGIPVSFQCLDTSFDFGTLEAFFKGLNGIWNTREVTLDCEVISARASYNFPKMWDLDLGSKTSKAISFSWMHQGMGDDKGIFGNRYVFKGAVVEHKEGEFLYLQGNNHYILPKQLL